ncbi:hypothetical protein A2690_04050 [Candidatus Roizmanbacteria bacterium RIFCSPHIGHO2_01_FULL_39_12b]|uniref:Glycosyltransferase RgtA/B/C/D-like domain-containing protein n=1 Tax=Candidatus Roizmanbacteria bacterium RIFCSPHIGHO2_01_FULL_39_12b TaxID=1802030 RepID=A0A1F7GCB6_9BACT|nr:MAG: hypothetical protein A2690_04050 [Candidatus Roizmanbacteria bacterium RIFCSPHIGHO2_01_FULL_39_12b]OGK47114.1 MAG: hypothetical protein A3B46_01775 [Candidatus Roizmanbacteria bacterium RIFCSPLOWO2_01_FULL_39_19]
MLFLLTRALTPSEGFSYLLSRLPFNEIISNSLSLGISPMYYIALHVWINIFGKSEIIMRSFSLIWFGIFILCVHHILIKVFSMTERRAYRNLFFFMFNPILLYFSMQTTASMMFVSLSTLSCYFLLRKNYSKFIIVSIFAGLTHWSFILVLFLQGVYTYSQSKKLWTGYLIHLLPILLATLPVLGIIAFQSLTFLVTQLVMIFGPIFFGVVLSFGALYVFRYHSMFVKSLVVSSGLISFIIFSFQVNKVSSKDLRAGIKNIKAVTEKGDVIYVADIDQYFQAVYYFDRQVYLYAVKDFKTPYSSIIPRSRFIKILPTYPNKAFVMDRSGNFEAVAAY